MNSVHSCIVLLCNSFIIKKIIIIIIKIIIIIIIIIIYIFVNRAIIDRGAKCSTSENM